MPTNLLGSWALLGLATLASCGANTSSEDIGGAGAGGRAADGLGATAGASGDSTADGEPFCAQRLDDCSSFAPRADASYCTLSQGIAAMCEPCGPGVACFLLTGIVHGATYTYLDVDNIDVDTRLAYDSSGALVAVLAYNANLASHWRCTAGPADFDPSEAIASPILPTLGNLRDSCGAGGAGGATP